MSRDWIAEVQKELAQFARERNWDTYHTPRNLAALIASEAGELLAYFRWDQDAMSDKREEVELELADVLLGVMRFADVAGVNLQEACRIKMKVNKQNYPVSKGIGPDRELEGRGER